MNDTQIRAKIAKLEQVTIEHGATSAEAATASSMAAKLRHRLVVEAAFVPRFDDVSWDDVLSWAPSPPPPRTHMPVGSAFEACGGVVGGSILDSIGGWRP